MQFERYLPLLIEYNYKYILCSIVSYCFDNSQQKYNKNTIHLLNKARVNLYSCKNHVEKRESKKSIRAFHYRLLITDFLEILIVLFQVR